MTLTPRQWRQTLYCVAEELRERRGGKTPGVRPWNAELVRAVELELAVSLSGQENSADTSELEHENWIGSEQAASILGWHVRKVGRRRNTMQPGKPLPGRTMHWYRLDGGGDQCT
jgi:hypothetical protein